MLIISGVLLIGCLATIGSSKVCCAVCCICMYVYIELGKGLRHGWGCATAQGAEKISWWWLQQWRRRRPAAGSRASPEDGGGAPRTAVHWPSSQTTTKTMRPLADSADDSTEWRTDSAGGLSRRKFAQRATYCHEWEGCTNIGLRPTDFTLNKPASVVPHGFSIAPFLPGKLSLWNPSKLGLDRCAPVLGSRNLISPGTDCMDLDESELYSSIKLKLDRTYVVKRSDIVDGKSHLSQSLAAILPLRRLVCNFRQTLESANKTHSGRPAASPRGMLVRKSLWILPCRCRGPPHHCFAISTPALSVLFTWQISPHHRQCTWVEKLNRVEIHPYPHVCRGIMRLACRGGSHEIGLPTEQNKPRRQYGGEASSRQHCHLYGHRCPRVSTSHGHTTGCTSALSYRRGAMVPMYDGNFFGIVFFIDRI